MTVALAIALLSLAIWLVLLFGRGLFWRATLDPLPEPPNAWPEVIAVVPARDEAAVVGDAVASLLRQDYPGAFRVVLVDDHSTDGTAEQAKIAARAVGQSDRLTVLGARDLPPGWSGKLWALSEGVRQERDMGSTPGLYLFTDADIVHHPTNLRELVSRIEAEKLDMASLMVLLRCHSFAERMLIPAFVFFFAMLYPFRWSNDRSKGTAAAAGGCILIRREAYERAGGYEAIRSELIDDCALARQVKRGGPIWLGLTRETRSLRAYPRLGDIWRMVARTAYTQLGYSPWLLGGTVLGMAATYVAPPVLAIFGGGLAAIVAGVAWIAMTVAFLPMLRFYGRSWIWAPLLPVIAGVYLLATVDSARRHWRGKGGEWKGRVQLRT